MVKHTQTIRRQFADKLFESVFDHFIGLALKDLMDTFTSPGVIPFANFLLTLSAYHVLNCFKWFFLFDACI